MSPRSLLLSPTTALASPAGWSQLDAPLPQDCRYSEVHCIGGGSLLLWLLAVAGRAPRGRVVYMHGPVVLPTPESCGAWLARAGGTPFDEYEWQRQAISTGVAGGLEHSPWLKPLMTSIATGRANELGQRAADMQRRWERHGRIVHRPLEPEDDVLRSLLHGAKFSIDVERGGEAQPELLQCGEAECATAR